MKSRTRLDSAVFQLTPTRTRYNLVINAKGETERISSGLLDPFLAHLKAAQEQFARGCYSIMLEPNHGCDAVWFTKGTVERFVRFVNTPDVLERVNMTESEILQIKDAIAIQNSEALGSINVLDHMEEEYREKSVENTEGSLPILNVDSENAVVIYKLGDHYINSNGSAGGENSKVQFLRVLESRKTMLQKEQGMAFARAIAAGFDLDRMLQLISFAEYFGAPRLMKACLGFMVLWEGKHAQGSKTEANEAMSSQSEFSSVSNYNILIHEFKKSEARSDSNDELGIKHNEKGSNVAAAVVTFDYSRGDDKFCQTLQGMPYHQNHLVGSPFLQPPYPAKLDSWFNNTKSVAMKRRLTDREGKNTVSEMGKVKVSSMSLQDGSELEKQSSNSQEQWSKVGQTGQDKSDAVAICNISYIGSKGRHDKTGGGSQSTPDPEGDIETKDMDYGSKHKQKKSMGSTRRKESKTRPTATGNSYDKEAVDHGREADIGKWKVFENILLRHDNEDRHIADQGVFPLGNEVFVKRQQNKTGANKMMINGGFVIYEQDTWSDYQISNSDPLAQCGFAAANKNLCKNSLSNCTDESFILPVRLSSKIQSKADCRAIAMDTELLSAFPMGENVPSRVTSQLCYEPDVLNLIPTHGTLMESLCYDPAVDYEMETRVRSDVTVQKRIKEDSLIGVKEISKKSDKDNAVKGKNGKVLKSSRPSELHECVERKRSVKPDVQKMKKTKEEEEIKRLEALKSERQKRISARSSSGPVQSTLSSQIKPQPKSKISPTLYEGSTFSTSETQLQGLSNRTASLESNVSQKIARQGNLNKANTQSTLPSQIRHQPQKKLLPTSYKGSKFSDSEPGPSSPLQRLRSRAASLRSNASQKITRPSGLNVSDQHALNKSIRSVKSLPELKKGNALGTPEMKVSAAQILRLSDPKISNISHVSLSKLGTTDSQEKVCTSGVLGMSQPKTRNRDQVSSTKLQNSLLIMNSKATDGSGVQMIPRVATDGSGVQKVSRIATDGSGVQKVSRIAPKDRSQVVVPRSLKCPPDMVQNHTKELALKTNHRSSVSPNATQVQQSNAKGLNNRNGEDKLVIETTVVLENEMSPIHVIEKPGEGIDTREELNNELKVGGNTRMVTESAAIEASVSAVVKDVGGSFKSPSDEVAADYAVKELPKCPSSGVSSKPNQTPLMHLFSLIESRASYLESSKVPPCISEVTTESAETTEGHASDFTDPSSLDKTPPGSIHKPRAKVFSKGVRRILRFGKTSEKNVDESDRMNGCFLVDSRVATTASSSKGKKLERDGFRRQNMSHALYIV